MAQSAERTLKVDKENMIDTPDETVDLEVDDADLDEDIGTVGEGEETDDEEIDPFASLYEDDEESDSEDEEELPNSTDNSTETADVEVADRKNEIEDAARALLLSLGAKPGDDPVKSLEKLTAEAMGISYAEYERRKATEKEEIAKWEDQAKRDIAAIHEAFPETKKYKSLKDLPNKMKFAKLMDDPDKNLTAVEAFAASHSDIVVAHGKLGGKVKSNLADTKKHITSNVPKGAKDNGVNISRRELESYREMFPELSDKEINRLYKNAMK